MLPTPLPAFAASLPSWLRHLGGPGLILLGLADNSLVPLPGSMDVATVWMSAHNRHLWLYYALMATAGAVAGGYLTYGLARKGGKEALQRKLGKRRAQKVFQRFERWGFWAVAIPALLPPPVPIVPFLLAAGALQYSRKKFVAALAAGRCLRFLIDAKLASLYGNAILQFFDRYYKPALVLLIGAAVAAGAFGVLQYMRARRQGPKVGEAQSGRMPA